jgi:hypothetical protein
VPELDLELLDREQELGRQSTAVRFQLHSIPTRALQIMYGVLDPDATLRDEAS